MKIAFSRYALIFLLASSPLNAQVRIVLTAALTDNCFEFRKNQYIESLNILADYGYKNPYIVEAIKKTGPTFLDDYSTNVFYAKSNNPSIRNHGTNEARTLLEALEYFKFSDDDIIFKMTGRYQLISNYVIKILEQNKNNFDAFILIPGEKKVIAPMKTVFISNDILKSNKRDLSQRVLSWKKKGFLVLGETAETTAHLQKIYDSLDTDPQKTTQPCLSGGVHCLAFAMRCKYLKEMLLGLDFPGMEHPTHWITLEGEMEHYFKRKVNDENFKIFYFDKLYIRANLFGSSTVPGHPEEIRIY